MIIDKENIKRTFSIFHDGTICGFEEYSDKLKLKVDCYYLSELINPEFEYFYVELYKPSKIEFEPWSNNEVPQEIIFDLSSISQFEYNIFNCKIVNGLYQMDVEIESPKDNLLGGGLNFNCKGIRVYDQLMNELTFEQLSNLSKKYWSEFENR